MQYSVFDWSARQFRVFQDSRPNPVMADWSPCRPGVRPGVAGMVDVNQTICPLPADAQFVGMSNVARGQIARVANGQMLGVPSSFGRRAPGLGALGSPMHLPDGGIGVAPQGGLGFSFTEAVVANVVIAVVSGMLSTLLYRTAFKSVMGTGAHEEW